MTLGDTGWTKSSQFQSNFKLLVIKQHLRIYLGLGQF